MGQQIHIGGFQSSMDLAQRAGIGAGCRESISVVAAGRACDCLVRFRNVAQMQGVDATRPWLSWAADARKPRGFRDRIAFTLDDACDTGLPGARADFVWGEDAWCYVVDKAKLIREAVRLMKPRGTIAFTDWMEGPAGLSDAEAERFCGS